MDARPLASAERAEFAAFCRTLTEDEWESPSLCDGWRVRDVVAHVIQVDDASPGRHLLRFIRTGFNADRFNAFGVAHRADWPTDRLTETLERQTELGWLSRIRRGLPALSDALVHQQDIRRPLGRPREIPEDRLRCVLDSPDPFVGATRRMKGLRFAATDIDWATGEGPEVRGPAEAIVMALAGRSVALAELSGSGVETLAERG